MFRNLFSNARTADVDLSLVKREVEENQAQILDVREKNEWDAGHLKIRFRTQVRPGNRRTSASAQTRKTIIRKNLYKIESDIGIRIFTIADRSGFGPCIALNRNILYFHICLRRNVILILQL